MAESNACISEQEDEILALSSIFGDDFSMIENNDCGTIYEIKIKVNLVGKKVQLRVWLPIDEEEEEEETDGEEKSQSNNPDKLGATAPKKMSFRRSESKQHSWLMLSVSHLTPLRLEFSFPSTYPTSSRPLYSLSCLWLDAYNLSRLCQKLDEIWESSCEEGVIFAWVDWLQNSSLEFLGAYESINLKPYEWDQESYADEDPRALTEFLEPKTSALQILEHDFRIEQKEFRKGNHICEICFEEKEGIFFHFLQECGHKFCVECLLDYCQMHVSEGTVRQLICPEKDCKCCLSPMILRELLNDEDFERWERLLFQQTLDGMIDVLYCPRCSNLVIQDEDQKSKLAQCRECFFSFCTECHMSWHSSQPCSLEDESEDDEQVSKKKRQQKRKMKQDSNSSETDDQVESAESRRMKKVHSAEKSGYQFLMLQKRLGNYQRCPKCRIMVEKTMGCDMMHCSRCGEQFCWTCGSKIKGYEHFSQCGIDIAPDVHDRARQMLENRPVAEQARRIKELGANPNMRMKLKICPRCRQKNMKEHRNNHMKCWSCKNDFCYQCGKQTGYPVSAHYNTTSPCVQHSDD